LVEAGGVAAAGAGALVAAGAGVAGPGTDVDARNAITALRSFSVLSPGNGILLPGTNFWGSDR